ncbi:MAG: DNA polymerase Y family protein, partial [Thermodesulfobacteriota bacterium]
CIAASYEAKKYGIKTGTNVAEARKICKELKIVESRPEIYIEIHHKIWSAVNSVLPVDKVLSIDEMACRLTGRQTDYDNAVSTGRRVKEAIKEQVGEYVKCSLGLAPNRFLAKVATDMEKPDGFTVITKEDLPHKLYSLSLTDLPGIGKRMHKRLKLHGVGTVEELCGLSENKITAVWQSVLGKRFRLMLMGEDVTEPETGRRTVSHSHVLAPKLRTEEGTRAVFVRLIHKAAFRLRRLGYLAGKMVVRIDYLGGETSWKVSAGVREKNDTQTMIEAFSSIWEKRPVGRKPLRASVKFTDLIPASETSFPLLSGERKRDRVANALDKINERWGASSIYYGAMHGASESAPLRIAFTSIPDIAAEGNKEKRSLRGSSKN